MKQTTTCAALLLLCASTAGAQTPTVDALIEKYLAARGGESRLATIETRRVSGTITIGDREAKLRVLAKRPNLMLQEMSTGDQRFITAFDGQQAWALNPMLGDKAQRVDGPPANALRDQAQFDGPLLGARRRGDRIEVVGRETVEGSPTWKLAVHSEDRIVHVFLDEQSGLERKVSATIPGEAGDVLIESVFSDYATIDGTMLPRHVETRVGGELQATVRLESVEFNVPLDDAEFRMPAER
jgi:outer membrane lipoprotein-sorting protein